MNRTLYPFDEDLIQTERIAPRSVLEPGALAWMAVWVLNVGAAGFAGIWITAAAGLYLLG